MPDQVNVVIFNGRAIRPNTTIYKHGSHAKRTPAYCTRPTNFKLQRDTTEPNGHA